MVGVVLITNITQLRFDLASLDGILAGFLSGVTYSATFMLSRRLRGKVSSFTQTLWGSGVAALLLSPWLFQVPGQVIVENLPVLVPLGVVTLGIASFVYYIALQRLKAQVVSNDSNSRTGERGVHWTVDISGDPGCTGGGRDRIDPGEHLPDHTVAHGEQDEKSTGNQTVRYGAGLRRAGGGSIGPDAVAAVCALGGCAGHGHFVLPHVDHGGNFDAVRAPQDEDG